jgi:hypothetical protein
MRLTHALLAAGLTMAGLGLSARGTERNFWPFWVGEKDASSRITEWQGAGPLLFEKPFGDGTAGGFRPIYVWKKNASGETTQVSVFYPLFTYRAGPDNSRWTVFSMINSASPRLGTDNKYHAFDLWPFYFSRQTGDPATSYRTFFPIAGTMKNRFGQDTFGFFLFPLYGRFEKNHVVTTTTPWPFVKVMRGEGNRGFELWPLFGQRAKTGAYREQYYLWPLIYKNEHALWTPQPEVKLGVLPFYTREQDADSISENYLWPFFGYTSRTAPYHYHETRYLWPLLVQGRGDERYVNRWGPFYTHSVIKGRDKTWVIWPLWRQIRWDEGRLAQTKTTVLYFLYWSVEQRSLAHPALPPARRTSLWPLFTAWDNGAGRRQVQVLSPFESFFPTNETVRLAYSPLFAIYRYDRRGPDAVRQDFLFNFITWQREPGHAEFHFGPFFKMEKNSGSSHVALFGGLIGLRRTAAGQAWQPFAFDFSTKAAKPQLTSR